MWQMMIIGVILVCAGLYLAGTFLKKWQAFREGRSACCACESSTATLENSRSFPESESSALNNSADSKQEC